MPPTSRGNRPRLGSYSKSTPNLHASPHYQPFPTAQQLLQAQQDGTASPETSVVPSVEESSLSLSSYADHTASSDSDSDSSDTTPSSSGLLPPLATKLPLNRPLLSHLGRSQSSLGNPIFAPPFYNRPPTPLPPSPSLTSLLRPSFSTTHFPSYFPSRPATPDSSDTEVAGTGASTSVSVSASFAAVAKSARTATPVPRASPRVPTYEYYGFVLYLGSSLAFLVYVLWSYLPTPFLHRLGIYYYPDRWWSLAVPGWLVMSLVYIYAALAAYNTGYLTLGMSSIENLVDGAASVAVVDNEGRIVRKGGSRRLSAEKGLGIDEDSRGTDGRELDWRSLWNEGTDAVLDIPIGGVCEVLYGRGPSNNYDASTDDGH